jgi:hypothetical protein
VTFLSNATGLRPSDVLTIINQAPVSYKRYTIPKRNGGRRLIAQPAKEVKKLQSLLAMRLSALPVHEAATAYIRGRSIRDNAERHASSGPILKFDFADFFPSIKARDWQTYCSNAGVFSEPEDIYLSSRLFFTREPGSTILRLAIGAPSSPWLSNVLMYEFDKSINNQVAKDKVIYSRYADDLTFSAQRTGFLNQVERTLRRTVASIDSPQLKINDDKTVLATKKYRRVVTGLVLANDGRVTIGRERKRHVRAALHHAFLGKLDGEEAGRLAGLLAYIKGVEPQFFEQLTSRYGADLIEKVNTMPTKP